MRMRVPRGTGAVAMSGQPTGDMFAAGPQGELLLQRGLPLRVTRDHGVVDGVRRLDVEVVPAPARPERDRRAQGEAGAGEAPRRAPKAVAVGTRVRLKPSAGSYATSGTVIDVLPGGDEDWYIIDAVDQEGRRTQLQLPRSKFTLLKKTRASGEPDDNLDDEDDEFEDEDVEDPGEPTEEQRAHAQAWMAGLQVQAAAGVDVTPGKDRLHHYWTRSPEGLAKWASSPHPWTTLVAHLTKHVGLAKAKIFASKWFKEVFGIWSGERKGRNPWGPG